MQLSVNVKVKSDTKMWDRMKKNLLRGGDKAVNVGWFSGNMHPTGVPTAQVAQWNEEGHVNGAGSLFPGTFTPPRPFFRNGFSPKVLQMIPTFYPMVDAVAKGRMTWNQLHKQAGFKLKETLQNVIEAWASPANSPVTISMKGKNDPLIDTGWMLDTVETRIVRRGGI